MGAQQSGAPQPGQPLKAEIATLQRAANPPPSAPLSTGNNFPAPVPIQKPPPQGQPAPQQPTKGVLQLQQPQPVNPPQVAPSPKQDKQNLFVQDKAGQGFTMHEEYEEEEEYEESQNMFATGFRSALKQNQGSINTQKLGQFGSVSPGGAGGALDDAIKDFKVNRQQSEMIEKENLKLPKMTQDGSNPAKPQPQRAPEQPIKPPVQAPQIPPPSQLKTQQPPPKEQPKLIQPVLTPQPVPKQAEPPKQQPPAKPLVEVKPVPLPENKPEPKPVQTQQILDIKKSVPNAALGLSYQSVQQIEDESAGFMTQHKMSGPPNNQFAQKQNTARVGKPGLLINTQDDEDGGQTLNDALTRQERMTMHHGGLINGDLASIENDEEENLLPYMMGERGLSVTSGLGKDRPRPPSNYSRPNMSLQKFNEINVPPRLEPTSMWPDQANGSVEKNGKNLEQQYMKKGTPSNKQVVSSRQVKAEQIQLMSQGIRESQVNDFGTHYSQDRHRVTPKGSFPGLPDETQMSQHTPGHRTQTVNLLNQVQHELEHGPISYEPLAKVDQDDIKDYYSKQDMIKENPTQAVHLLAPNQKKPQAKNRQQSTPKIQTPAMLKDDLETTQVFKNMKQKYDEDLLSNANHESVRSITQVRAAARPAQPVQHRAPPPQVQHQRANNHLGNPYLQVGSTGEDEGTYNYNQGDAMDYSKRLNQYTPINNSMESSHYFPGINDKSGLNKQFGVYTFEDKTPLFERKARLIERLIVKKDESGQPDEPVDRTKFKVRSIPGGAGHQIVFSNRSEQQHAVAPPNLNESYGNGSSQFIRDSIQLPQIGAPVKAIQSRPQSGNRAPSAPDKQSNSQNPPGMIKPFETQQQLTMVPNSLPRRLPRYEELQKQKLEIQSRRTQQIMANQKIQTEDFKVILWGYLSCADRLELQKLYKMSTENLVVRDFRELHFNQPFPLTQAKSSRVLSPLYTAVGTGCQESVNIIFEEMTWISVESGIEIKKKQKDEEQQLILVKGDKPIKKRTPLQLACALGLYKIVELLLFKGANPNGIEGSDVNGQTDFFFPPIVLCASKKLRQQLLEELVGINIWQVFDNNYEVSHVQCLEALLRNKADPNLDVSALAPAKPFPVFYCLKQRNFVAKLVQYGGDVNVTDRDGLTPLCRVIDKPAKSSNAEGVGIAEDEEQKQLEVVDTLVGLGKARTVHCCSLNPILTAIKRGKYIIARYVAVKGGGDVNWRNPGQPSAVQIAVDQDNVILLEEVLGWPKLESPLDLDYTDPKTGTNIMHRIAKHSNLELFNKLVQSGRLHTHPQLLYRCLNMPILGHGPVTVPLLQCCPNIDLASAFLREGAGLGGLTFRQCYEMYSTTDPKFLEFLLNESGQLDVNEVDPSSGHTCLITAAEDNDLKKMNFLLKLGADPDCRYPEDAEQRLGMTLLHEAALKGKVDQAKILLSFGANFNLKCHRGRTTLDFLRTGHEQKSNRRREEMKTLLYKYTVKNNIFKQ